MAPNGVENLSAKAIVDKAVAATQAAPTHRLVMPEGVDLTMEREGNCAGTVSVTSTATSPQQVLCKNDKVWVKPKDEAAYYASEEGKALLSAVPGAKGKYMHRTTDAAGSMRLLSLYCEFGDLGKSLKSVSAVKGGKTTVDGHNTVSVKLTSRKQVVTFHVATDGKPYILKMASSKDGKVTEILLSDFGKPFAPPAAQTFDAAKAEEAVLMSSGSGLGGSS
ncbi:hypothetical protein ACFQ6Q_04680 [Streptomyces sp. NPDC056437]|uniref:hypothetical protein n=1 Tax=Streptomyces sp. NPDC056437 TaxID=3345816 RepID=UPI00367DF250